MDPILPKHIIIDNLPAGQAWYQLWIPIIIAFISILISGYSMYYTRKTFTLNTRPYIWAVSYSYLQEGVLKPNPAAIIFTCKEYPAKVSYKVSITFKNKTVFSFSQAEQIQFPDGSQWWFAVGQNDYDRIMNRSIDDKALLNRIIEINYSDLNSNKTYKSILKQVFIPTDNQWRTIASEAN